MGRKLTVLMQGLRRPTRSAAHRVTYAEADATTCRCTPGIADERMLGLGRVAVHRSRFPVPHSPDSAWQGSSQSLGRLPGTTDGELDLLVDLTG